MFVVKISGGLGNQLFQYSFIRALEEKYSTNVVYDLSSYKNDMFGRYFQLGDFPNIKLSDKKLVLNKGIVLVNDTFNYDDFNKNISSVDLDDNIALFNGYWQSEKYFKDIESKIRQELSLNVDFNPLPNSIALHVRRGDYLTLQHIHPVQGVEYYNNAIDEIGDFEKIYVFSEDVEWCRANLKFSNIEFMKADQPAIDILKMSKCTHNIIANSSFSWWGAWLNNNPNKKVIAPLKWFGDTSHYSDKDLIPSKWKRI